MGLKMTNYALKVKSTNDTKLDENIYPNNYTIDIYEMQKITQICIVVKKL